MKGAGMAGGVGKAGEAGLATGNFRVGSSAGFDSDG